MLTVGILLFSGASALKKCRISSRLKIDFLEKIEFFGENRLFL